MAKFTKEDIGKEVVLTQDQDGLLAGATGIICEISCDSVYLNNIKGKFHSNYCDECNGEDDDCEYIEEWSDEHDSSYSWVVRQEKCEFISISTNNLILLLI